MANNLNVRIPPITSLRKAIELYYSRTELGNSDIEELFGKHSSSTIARLKSKAETEFYTNRWSRGYASQKQAPLCKDCVQALKEKCE